MLNKLLGGILLSASLIAAPSFAQTYHIDKTHSMVIASWTHFGFSHPKAIFSDIQGSIDFDPKVPEKASVNVSIPVQSVDTKVPDLTKEFIEQADYFDVKKYPNATFKSTKVVKVADKKFDVTGTLTIKGISKTVVFHATLNGLGEHPMVKKPAIGFDASTTIKRSDFGLDKYIPFVSDQVVLSITTEALAK